MSIRQKLETSISKGPIQSDPVATFSHVHTNKVTIHVLERKDST